MSATATDWPAIHEHVVEQFRAGWDQPDPHAWDSFLGESMEFVQPMLRNGVGREVWYEETLRLLKLMPDVRAEVLSWAGVQDTLFLHIRLEGTLGGKPLAWEAVDLLRITPDGTGVFRESFFDSGPVAAEVLRRPGAWLRWWRSGVGPFPARRRLLKPVTSTGGRR